MSVITGLLTIYLLFIHQLQLESTGGLHPPRGEITVFDYFQVYLFSNYLPVIGLLIIAAIFSSVLSTGSIVGFSCSVVFYLSYDKGLLIGLGGATHLMPANISSTIFFSVVLLLLSIVQWYIFSRLSELVGKEDYVLVAVLMGRD